MSSIVTEEMIARQTPEAQAIIRLLLAEIQELKSQVVELQSQVVELKSQVRKLTPRNSSLPPSSQHPRAKPIPAKSPSKRKRGGQPGHPRHLRELIPPVECSAVIPLRPSVCSGCGERLRGNDPEPRRHQVWELPEIKPVVTEYQQHRLACPGCGKTTCADLPLGVPRGQSGPNLVAFTGLLMGHFRQSKRRAALFLQDLLKFPCCPALTVKMPNQVATALKSPYDERQQELAKQPQVFMDESPTKQANQKAWLWTAVTKLFAVFAIFSSRKGDAVPKLLGDSFRGIVHCDRAKMYRQAERLQWCGAHLKRDFQALIDHPDRQVQRLGHDLMRPVKLMFRHWRADQSGDIDWPTFHALMSPIRETINGLLQRGTFRGNRRLVGMCQELHNHREWLWTFVDHEGVDHEGIEPTNNTAERARRPAVICRKLSFGTQSASGSRFLERILTVSETCRLQNRSIYDYLATAVQAHFKQQPIPSLLPCS